VPIYFWALLPASFKNPLFVIDPRTSGNVPS